MIRPPERPGFGKPGSVTAAAIAALPTDAQRAEGVLLLAEMGRSLAQIAKLTGLHVHEVGMLQRGNWPKFVRGGETI